MIPARGYAALDARSPLAPFRFERREPGPRDVLIAIRYCGVCHSDLHQVRDEWGGSRYPMVPGHEIVGEVVRVGAEVTRVKPGDRAGVGCMVGSCRTCPSCVEGHEQYCANGFTGTYNALDRDGETPTYGGYAENIVVDQDFVLRIPDGLDLARAAPLLCAGVTTWSPLRHWRVGPGQLVGVVGLGGLGHMAVQFARAFGAHVVVFTTSADKADDALRLGAHEVVISRDEGALQARAGTFDFVLDTVSATHDLNVYLGLLRRDGALVLVGAPAEPLPIEAFRLIMKRRTLAGSLIGGIAETQAMLDFCAQRGIACDVEVIPIQQIERAYERMVRGDVRYRFVIDLASLQA